MTRSKGCGVEGRTDVAGDGGGKVELGAAINRAVKRLMAVARGLWSPSPLRGVVPTTCRENDHIKKRCPLTSFVTFPDKSVTAPALQGPCA
jgi:hypothetical protein